MASAWDIVNLVLAVLGVIGIIQLPYAFVRRNLPAQRLKVFNDIFDDTNVLYHNVVEDGLIGDKDVAQEIRNHLSSIHSQSQEIRAKVVSATTFRQQFRGLTSGLSKQIRQLCSETLELRARISSVSERERERLENQGLLVRRPLISRSAPIAPSAVADPSVTRRLMNPAFNRLLQPGAPFSANTLTTLMQASRAGHSAQGALRNSIPLVPLRHGPNIQVMENTPQVFVGNAVSTSAGVATSGADQGSNAQDLSQRINPSGSHSGHKATGDSMIVPAYASNAALGGPPGSIASSSSAIHSGTANEQGIAGGSGTAAVTLADPESLFRMIKDISESVELLTDTMAKSEIQD